MAFLAALGPAISGASNISSTAISSGVGFAQNQENVAAAQQMQGNQLAFNKSVMDQAVKSFTSAGLPSWMAFSNNSTSNSLPGERYFLGGSNSYLAGAGTTSAPIMTNFQQYLHAGKPSENAGMTQRSSTPARYPGLGSNFVPSSGTSVKSVGTEVAPTVNTIPLPRGMTNRFNTLTPSGAWSNTPEAATMTGSALGARAASFRPSPFSGPASYTGVVESTGKFSTGSNTDRPMLPGRPPNLAVTSTS